MEESKPLLEENINSPRSDRIGIIGTGNYGIAFGKRFLMFGLEVVYGSRRPNKEYLKESFGKLAHEHSYNVTTITDAWNKSGDVIFLAVNAKQHIYQEIVNSIVNSIKNQENNPNEPRSKIVVEISNRSDDEELRNVKISNAELLDDMFASKLNEANIFDYKVHVVKGFNLIDPYSLSSFIDTSGERNYYDKSDLVNTNLVVPLSGNNVPSKMTVIDLCNRIGLRAYDFGQLATSSLKLELANIKTFDIWFTPSIYCIFLLIVTSILMFFTGFIFPKKPITWDDYLKKFSLISLINRALGYTALQQLAFIYLASVFASIYQLKYSTKYQRFPKYLDYWLKTRKQFGLWAFLLASAHLIVSVLIVSPNYFKPWFRSPTEPMTIHGEINILTGILAYIIMLLVALASINSIASSLNWNEWRFVQTKLGITCLVIGTSHSFIMFLRNLIEHLNSGQISLVFILTRPKLIATYVPVFVLVLRFVFAYFKPLARRIKKIREGDINISQKETS